jgi:hypothetical protein
MESVGVRRQGRIKEWPIFVLSRNIDSYFALWVRKFSFLNLF